MNTSDILQLSTWRLNRQVPAKRLIRRVRSSVSLIRATAVVNHFNKHLLSVKVDGEYYSRLADADTVATRPLSGSFPHVNRNHLAHELLDCFSNRLTCEPIAQTLASEKLFRLPAERETPFHGWLNSYAYGTDSPARWFLVQLFNIFLLLFRHGRQERSTQAHHLYIQHLSHALARKSFYFVSKRRNHACSLAWHFLLVTSTQFVGAGGSPCEIGYAPFASANILQGERALPNGKIV